VLLEANPNKINNLAKLLKTKGIFFWEFLYFWIQMRYTGFMKHPNTLNFASEQHAARNLLYNNQPYSVHLKAVYAVLEPGFGDHDVIMQAALCHDLLEDTGITYNDLQTSVGSAVADVVYDVTNELGKNRQERAERTYPKIAANPLAVIVKVADRIANTNYSKTSGSGMFGKYCAEFPKFRNVLYNPKHVEQYPALGGMWDVLGTISNS